MNKPRNPDVDAVETREWLDSLEAVLRAQGPARAADLVSRLMERSQQAGAALRSAIHTPYVNTIPVDRQPAYPGDRAIERRIKSWVRWNAMAMVVRANRESPGIGGHISTFASAATLYQVGFQHFFRGKTAPGGGDLVYYQGHAAPGIYAQAFLEGTLSVEQLNQFRRQLRVGGPGLSSYPHPWLMPEFWEFPTVSMGLGAISSIYQARFNHYLQDRGLKDTSDSKVWVFLGDGETDEPETLGAITLAAREELDNLIFVVNCNLQRLDGPVRGNGKIIQELEAAFRGAGWNVIKVIWGDDWDPLLAADTDGLLVQRMNETVDGAYQHYVVAPGAYIREKFFGAHPELLKMVEHLSDEQLQKMRRGGHDPAKVYAAYRAAVEHRGQPTVILAKTIKGYGLGEAGEGRNITHQQKKLNEEELRQFRDRFDIPIRDDQLADAPFYKPPEHCEEMEYLRERRRALGGPVPRRTVQVPAFEAPGLEVFGDVIETSAGREVATTMAAVRMLAVLMGDKRLGKLIVPIVPDEARTFGMDPLFRKFGIHAHKGQLYEPVDSHLLLYYREAIDGQILEEGINEAGAMASFTAAGTAYASHGIHCIPFFFYYSMFGFQRIGDSIWAHADMRGKGFLIGATAGRTTLAGEGLQHQDGHSLLHASTVPNCVSYDAAYVYELGIIMQDGIRRMYAEREDVFYYLTVYNEKYVMPPMPDGVREGVLKGLYRVRATALPPDRPFVHLFGSGAILNGVLRAQEILAERFGVAAEVWSATSYTELRREALDCARWNRLHPTATPRVPYVAQQLAGRPAHVIAASDYVKLLPEQVARWTPHGMTALGTDGFGRSESREALRRFFEVDAAHVVVAALHRLAVEGKVPPQRVAEAIAEFGLDAEAPPPRLS